MHLLIQGCIGSIAIDDAALEKVCPSNIRHAEIVCTVTEEQYNNVERKLTQQCMMVREMLL